VQDTKTDLEITEKAKGLGAKPARPISYLCSLQNRAGGASDGVAAVQEGQIAGGSRVLRLGHGGEKEEGVEGTKLWCSLAEERSGSGRNPRRGGRRCRTVPAAAARARLARSGVGARRLRTRRGARGGSALPL
jgi:hypothetical protein